VINRRSFAVGALALAAGARYAQAQSPIRILVGYPAGGGVDIVARLLGEPIKAAFGQAVIVENRSGASAMIAANAVAKSPPDGATLLMAASGEVAINQHLHKEKMTYDPLRELSAVALVGIVPCVVVVAAATPVKNAAELIAYARANRGKLSFSSSGIGNPQQLAGELMNHMAGTDVLHVPYRGSAPALTDMISGQVHVMFDNVLSSISHLQSGALRPLAVTSRTRLETLPDVPTVAETVPGYETGTWWGVGVPKGTPAEIVEKLNREINASLADPKIKARFAELGSAPFIVTPQAFATFLAAETEKWGKAVKFSGASVD
jgi:tripartite-type tricarboxylate transporter receptor subunit TctC